MAIESKEERRKILGGSEMCAAAGWDEWKSQYQLWEEKMGHREPFRGNEATKRGVALEDWVRREASERLGIAFRRSHRRMVDRVYPWMIMHADALSKEAGLECKTTSFRNKKKFAADGTVVRDPEGCLPLNYYCQVQQYMAISGKKLWYLAVEILGENELRILEVPENPVFQHQMRNRAVAFWISHVQAKEPPELVILQDINEVYKQGKDEERVTNPELLDVIEQYCQIKEHREALAGRLSHLEAQIKKSMADVSRLVQPDGSLIISWQNQERRSLDTARLKKELPDVAKEFEKVSSTRVFRVVSDDS